MTVWLGAERSRGDDGGLERGSHEHRADEIRIRGHRDFGEQQGARRTSRRRTGEIRVRGHRRPGGRPAVAVGRLSDRRPADSTGEPHGSRRAAAHRPGYVRHEPRVSARLHLERRQAEQADRVRHHADPAAGALSRRRRAGAHDRRGRLAAFVDVQALRRQRLETQAAGPGRPERKTVRGPAAEAPEPGGGLQSHPVRHRPEGAGTGAARHLRSRQFGRAADPAADARFFRVAASICSRCRRRTP